MKLTKTEFHSRIKAIEEAFSKFASQYPCSVSNMFQRNIGVIIFLVTTSAYLIFSDLLLTDELYHNLVSAAFAGGILNMIANLIANIRYFRKQDNVKVSDINTQIISLKQLAPDYRDVKDYCDSLSSKVESEQKKKASIRLKYYILISVITIATLWISAENQLEPDTSTDRIYSTLFKFQEGQKFVIQPYSCGGQAYTADSLTFSITNPNSLDSCKLCVDPVRIYGAKPNESYIITLVDKDGNIAAFTPSILCNLDLKPEPFDGGCQFPNAQSTSIHWSGLYYYSQFLTHLQNRDIYFKIERGAVYQ